MESRVLAVTLAGWSALLLLRSCLTTVSFHNEHRDNKRLLQMCVITSTCVVVWSPECWQSFLQAGLPYFS